MRSLKNNIVFALLVRSSVSKLFAQAIFCHQVDYCEKFPAIIFGLVKQKEAQVEAKST